ncbi:unnamed protein product [Bursaphelenchus okinawaensis]|uniref:Transcription factor TFIIIB component B'' Myb domain-containing protein n=1 Tax=Bursaphelenchus okinawaensis TaxID=465554 RepID=A0A811JUC4_9BILA|nr:unnamed protein product [Bursaphelenchus okinawaensis]CAG9083627.1 unnamed protein product [Bursaphelenchus okinawaensis]
MDEPAQCSVDIPVRPRKRTNSTCSTASVATTSTVGRRRRAELQAELDTKTFKMSDLIIWRPQAENELRKKWDEQKQKLLENMSNSSNINQEARPPPPKKPVVAPRVKLNEKGEIVIDEESLVVTETAENNVWDHVDDDAMPKKLNSLSFRKKANRSTNWSILETDLFYQVLSATGPDFGLMHEFIPHRTRAELKRKYTKEERENEWRIDHTVKNPSLLSKDLYNKVKVMMDKMEQEKQSKDNTRIKRRKKAVSANEKEVESQ